MKYGGLLVCWLLGSAAVITIYWLHFIIRSAVSQRTPFSIYLVVSQAAWWAVLLFVIVCSSAYSCSYPSISSPVSINPAHAPQNGFLSSDAMTVHHSETSAFSTNMCHREGVPSAPPPTSHQSPGRKVFSPLPRHCRHGMIGVWSRLCPAPTRVPGTAWVLPGTCSTVGSNRELFLHLCSLQI